MYFRKIIGPDGHELRLMGVPKTIDLANYMGLVRSIAMELRLIQNPDEIYNDVYADFEQDFTIRTANADLFDCAVDALTRKEIGAVISRAAAMEIKQAPFHESAYRLTEADVHIDSTLIDHDQRGYVLGGS